MNGRTIMLPNREFRILEMFLGNIDRILTKEDIVEQMYGFDDAPGSQCHRALRWPAAQETRRVLGIDPHGAWNGVCGRTGRLSPTIPCAGG